MSKTANTKDREREASKAYFTPVFQHLASTDRELTALFENARLEGFRFQPPGGGDDRVATSEHSTPSQTTKDTQPSKTITPSTHQPAHRKRKNPASPAAQIHLASDSNPEQQSAQTRSPGTEPRSITTSGQSPGSNLSTASLRPPPSKSKASSKLDEKDVEERGWDLSYLDYLYNPNEIGISVPLPTSSDILNFLTEQKKDFEAACSSNAKYNFPPFVKRWVDSEGGDKRWVHPLPKGIPQLKGKRNADRYIVFQDSLGGATRRLPSASFEENAPDGSFEIIMEDTEEDLACHFSLAFMQGLPKDSNLSEMDVERNCSAISAYFMGIALAADHYNLTSTKAIQFPLVFSTYGSHPRPDFALRRSCRTQDDKRRDPDNKLGDLSPILLIGEAKIDQKLKEVLPQICASAHATLSLSVLQTSADPTGNEDVTSSRAFKSKDIVYAILYTRDTVTVVALFPAWRSPEGCKFYAIKILETTLPTKGDLKAPAANFGLVYVFNCLRKLIVENGKRQYKGPDLPEPVKTLTMKLGRAASVLEEFHTWRIGSKRTDKQCEEKVQQLIDALPPWAAPETDGA